MVWSEFPEDAEFGEPFPCDFRGCERDATHAYIGEGGDVYLCPVHYRVKDEETGREEK